MGTPLITLTLIAYDYIAHAKGHLVKGTFTPTSNAAELCKAPQFSNPSTPITVRFSSNTGLPKIGDNDPSANPRGFALRFHLGERVHTDIIAHSAPLFPTRTGPDFLDHLRAQVASANAAVQGISLSPLETFLSAHPETVRFIQYPKPSPVSFATEPFFGVNAFEFISDRGTSTYVRYRIVPVIGEDYISDEELKTKSPTYLFDELPQRLQTGPIEFKLLVQIAHEDDVVDDATVQWADDRELVELGMIELDSFVSDDDSLREQKRIIFDPVPRVEGIEPSDDPLIDFRAAIYLASGLERRQAEYAE